MTRVLVDANVLYSKTLRDWFCLIQVQGGPYTGYYSEDILAETAYRLRRKDPTAPGHKIRLFRDRIVASLEGGRVEDFVVDGTFKGDPDDQHVHAAALACGAQIVLTADKGFTAPGVIEDLPYEVHRPDEFFTLTDDSCPHVVREVAVMQTDHFQKRYGSADLCSALRGAGCPDFAERVRRHLFAHFS